MRIFERLGLNRTAKAITKRAIVLKAASLVTAALTLTVGVTYLIAYFYQTTGSFTVKLNRYDMLKAGLSLSETKTFERPISRLIAGPLQEADNISVNDLPATIGTVDGEHSGSNYIAYTYYVRNMGQAHITYQTTLDIQNASQGIDAAIRIRVYQNDELTTYAKMKNDGTGPEKDTVPFLSQTVAMQDSITDFAPDAIDKYTVVIWLEGDDPECIDNIIGGTMKLVMNLKVVESS